MIAISWLLLVWAPMMQRDNEIDPQRVLQDSQAKIDEVRSKLHDLQNTWIAPLIAYNKSIDSTGSGWEVDGSARMFSLALTDLNGLTSPNGGDKESF